MFTNGYDMHLWGQQFGNRRLGRLPNRTRLRASLAKGSFPMRLFERCAVYAVAYQPLALSGGAGLEVVKAGLSLAEPAA